ncbi:hypothetical protein SteCoe_32007 [Stentor coeruleus]|uniref:G-protein coupled receptors family 2 profile 2 domain-containing protein n=1 Tax=Stentor coeruleus TaxID=5963 RepID=A0A1R2B0D6_9CILI|nr:hypothetical protein SteCoe_32007 [Stentor coeruleus]
MGCNSAIEDRISISVLIIVCVSLICSLILLVFCILSDILEEFTRKILFYLSLNTMLRSLVNLMLKIKVMWNACFIIAYLNDVFLVSTVIWASLIPITLYMVLVKKKEYNDKYYKRGLFFSYVIVSLILALPFITKNYDREGEWCTLESNERGIIWGLALVYLPSWIMICIVTIFYIKTYFCIKNTTDIKFRSILFERGMIFSVIIAFTLLPMTIMRIFSLFFSGCMIIYFHSIAYSISHLLGFYNLIALLMNQNIQKVIKIKLTRNDRERIESHTGATFLISSSEAKIN